MRSDGESATLTFPVERVAKSRVHEVDFSNVPFSSIFSDHMFCAEYNEGRWDQGRIQPYGPISLTPSITALHYGISVFEGMKAYKASDGKPLLFRPLENARRFQRSAARLALPPVTEAMFLEAIRELVRLDHGWIPPSDAGALYIRPILFSTDPSIRVKPADQCQFVIFTFPFGAYFSAPVDVLVSENYIRAFPGGTGDIKPAGNYGAALLADQEARQAGCNAVLWLDPMERRFVEECGVMNVFFVIGNRVVTPPLSGTILPGVTRASVITLLRDMGFEVSEEQIAIDDVFRSYDRRELRECFGTGTAATISHVGRIRYRHRVLELPPVEERKVATAVRDKLLAVMTGREADPHGWVEKL